MERIQAAIQKAKEQRGMPTGRQSGAGAYSSWDAVPAVTSTWEALEVFEPDPDFLTDHRIVTYADTDPSDAAVDMLRTRILRTMRENRWIALGITSPSSGCGKSVTSLNLAFSLARQSDVRTVLVDLDLRRPALAKTLGLARPQSMASILQGTRPVTENFVRVGNNLAIGTNASPVRNSSEILLNPATAQGVTSLKAAFRPNVLLFDLPPMLVSDDVMAFLPHLDCVLLVAGAEKTRLDEVDACEQDLSGQSNFLGVVLNMCRYGGETYGYY
jgi:protein-tyrosine kinase